ncbi:DUF1192 domain-containing protein [Novosphingobium sp.]|jgi:uncharacterized small protein (DUF1192 family)|uniref:DUF1192 domain-containing protein n=1 Tax=Novosphingobium sp. TaxID=1874826 RepID=UPI002FDE9245
MDLEDLPRRKGDLVSQLASEPLDTLSIDELATRIALLEAEIVRTRDHRDRAGRTRAAADALFARAAAPPPAPPATAADTPR